jgi:hypothetical protein
MVVDGKNDLNRVGWFSEMGYISIGDPYKPKKNGNILRFNIFDILDCLYNLVIRTLPFVIVQLQTII